MTIPQIEVYAVKAGMFKIGPMGMAGKGGGKGKNDKPNDAAPSMSVAQNAASWVAAFSGIG
jgi:hypothetical protein